MCATELFNSLSLAIYACMLNRKMSLQHFYQENQIETKVLRPKLTVSENFETATALIFF